MLPRPLSKDTLLAPQIPYSVHDRPLCRVLCRGNFLRVFEQVRSRVELFFCWIRGYFLAIWKVVCDFNNNKEFIQVFKRIIAKRFLAEDRSPRQNLFEGILQFVCVRCKGGKKSGGSICTFQTDIPRRSRSFPLEKYERVPFITSLFYPNISSPRHLSSASHRRPLDSKALHTTVGVSYYPSFSLYIHKSRERANLPNKSCNHVLDRDKRLFRQNHFHIF